MKILVTADLHYDITRSRRPTEDLARRICQTDGDALVLVGDTAGAQLGPLREVLALFDEFSGRKLFVPGNHCLWCRAGETSLQRYEQILPELIGEYGFELLDHSPIVAGGTALVGSIGWYDYSFANESLGIPEAFYAAKVAPGAAMQLGGFEELLAAHRDELGERAMAIRCRWMDGVRCRLQMDDKDFCRRLCDRLAEQLRDVSAEADRIVVFMHHLPFAELLPTERPDRVAFASAFLGAGCFGEVLLNCYKVSRVYCGHSHWTLERRIGHITAVNVGSTYTDKRLEILEV